MSIALAATWEPRGELTRLEKLIPILVKAYSAVIVIVHPRVEVEIWQGMLSLQEALSCQEDASDRSAGRCQVYAMIAPDWSEGRRLSLEVALKTATQFIHYADLDRLVRWVETRPDEWLSTLASMQRHDCLIIGRTEAAYRTHPRALVYFEALSNLVISRWLGKDCDVSAGSKSFSRQAVEFLVANALPGRALGKDAEWPILLQRAGFAIESIFVDGLDWESADRYQAQAARSEDQRQAAQDYDSQLENWMYRIKVTQEIIQSGLDAMHCPLVSVDHHARLLSDHHG